MSLQELIEQGAMLDVVDPDTGVTVRDRWTKSWLSIRDKRGKLVPLILNRAQEEYARRRTNWNIVLKARQVGITTYIASRFLLNTIMRPGTVTVQVAHDMSSAEAIFRIVHRFVQNLPEDMRKGHLKTSRVNARQIAFPSLDSEYRVETAGDRNAGRGITIHNLHCSEVAQWPRDASETLASLRAAVVPDGEIVLESTANGAGGCFYEEWQKAAEKNYTRHFFPWWWEESYQRKWIDNGMLSVEEEALMDEYNLTYQQIAFRREIRAGFGKRAKQEYAENATDCFLASGECIFDAEILENRLVELGDPKTRDNGRIQIFLEPRKEKKYVIGVDPAGGGVHGDYSAAQVVEEGQSLQCAELQGHYTPEELAAEVARLGSEYNNAMVAVERNNHGTAVLVELKHLNYTNLYQQKGQLGWLTTLASRPRMIAELATELRTKPQLFESKRLLTECKAFIRKADGSASAASGAHDDLVMAMAITLAAMNDADRHDQH